MIINSIRRLSMMNCVQNEIQWKPWSLLQQDNSTISNYAIVVLNTPIYWKPEFLSKLWRKASVKVLVDGGINRWHKWINQNNLALNNGLLNPDLVTGDMDSIDRRLLQKIQENDSIKVVYTLNQDETDFTKALREVKTFAETKNIKIENIISIADSWGRIDHTFANVETLYISKKIFDDVNVFLLSSDSLSWLLQPGKHRIEIPESISKCWCALIPIGKKCERICTKGLKWNLTNRSMNFGELVSTSNTYDSCLDYVSIDTSDTILWSMGLCGIPTSHDEFS